MRKQGVMPGSENEGRRSLFQTLRFSSRGAENWHLQNLVGLALPQVDARRLGSLANGPGQGVAACSEGC